MRVRHGHESLLNRISSSVCQNASEIHHVELERLDRRASAARRLQEMLTDLKDRLAQKASLLTPSVRADQSFERPHKAA
jgi:hypothetical protein